MTPTGPERQVVRDAVMLACRAPSLHNSQPWRWVADGAELHLFADRKRLVQVADFSGRELILSCGAALDHFRVAMAAAGWDARTCRFPNAGEPDHLASLDFARLPTTTDVQRQRAAAILRRRTDRLPFAVPRNWAAWESQLRSAMGTDDVALDVVPEDAREQLAEASRLTEALRRPIPPISPNCVGGHRRLSSTRVCHRVHGWRRRRLVALTSHGPSRPLDTAGVARRLRGSLQDPRAVHARRPPA